MELLDRYLNAVQFWLPRRQATDVTAELSADLRSEIEEQERGVGRALSLTEQEAILTRWGHPMLIAGRYQPQESLIGPVLLPAYRFVLKLLLAVYCLPWFLVWGGLMIFDASWRAAHVDVIASLQPLLFNMLLLFTFVTAIFAATERQHRRNRTLENWTPHQLIDPRSGSDWRDISRLGSIIEIGIGVAVLAWWSSLANAPVTFAVEGAIRLTWAPLHAAFYWPMLALMAGGIALSCANLLHPRWTLRRLAQQAALDTTGLVLALLLLPSSLSGVVTAIGADNASKLATVVTWINRSWTLTLAIAAVILAVRLIQGVRRMSRLGA